MDNLENIANLDLRELLSYIDLYWSKIIISPEKHEDDPNFLDVPYAYVTPNTGVFQYIFYERRID